MKITNWDTWQTFRKDRGTPPWIKVYRNLLTNSEWVSLSDSEKGQLVSMWMIAADKNGTIPDDPKVIQKMALLDDKPNINKFISLGFLTTNCQPTGNHLVTTWQEVDAPETEKRQSREEKDKSFCSNEFERWWKVYPKKVGKKKALVIWKRAKPDADTLIADTLNRIANDQKWKEGFIKDPERYLSYEQWNDELQSTRPAELTEADKYELRQQRNQRIIQTLDDNAMGLNVPALPSPVDEDERRNWFAGISGLVS